MCLSLSKLFSGTNSLPLLWGGRGVNQRCRGALPRQIRLLAPAVRTHSWRAGCSAASQESGLRQEIWGLIKISRALAVMKGAGDRPGGRRESSLRGRDKAGALASAEPPLQRAVLPAPRLLMPFQKGWFAGRSEGMPVFLLITPGPAPPRWEAAQQTVLIFSGLFCC